jgi:hypothetical protein
MNPFAPLAAAGVRLVLGSDAPVTPLGPWEAVRACVLPHVPEHGIGPEEAFEAHSAAGWRVAGQPGAGRLAPGAEATFAVWDPGDLLISSNGAGPGGSGGGPATPGAALPDLSDGRPAPACRMTVRRGRMVYNRDATGAAERDTPTATTRPTRPGRQPS